MKNLRIPDVLRIQYLIVFLAATILTPASGSSITVEPPQYPLNVKKTVSGFPEGQTIQVAPDEQITYDIEFDNNNNDVVVTGISIVDTLSSDVSFVSASGDRIIGNYNRIEHTFSWYYLYISPGETIHLDLTVKVNSDVTPGQSITNVVTVDSTLTSESTASVEVIVTKEDGSLPDDDDQTGGEMIIDSDDIQVIPDIINRENPSGELTVVVKLPADIGKNDVPDERLVLRPSGLVAYEQFVSETEGRTTIRAIFDKAALLNAVTEDYFGPLDLEVAGSLTSDRTFHGYTTIYLIGDGVSSDYISSIDVSMNQIWDYGDPNDDTDLTYEFQLFIVTSADSLFAAFDIDDFVKNIEFITPAGYTFQIPKVPGQWSDSIWKSYEYNPEWNSAIWEYRARSSNLNDLKVYGDGQYTIKVNDVIGSQNQATVWFGIPGINDPIPQPTQKPILTSPGPGKAVSSPVTFSWEPCTDKNTTEILISLEETDTGRHHKEYAFNKEHTSWGPVMLLDGSWQVELAFGRWFSYDNDNGISGEVGKYSRSRQQFTAVGSPRSTYEVWGGNNYIGLVEGRYLSGGYGSVDLLLANGYVKLGESQGQTATFSGIYQYYLIATRGEVLIDSIQGPDESNYLSFETNMEWMNLSEPNNLLGPPDKKYATLGGMPTLEDFTGYIVLPNPGNWTELTTITTTTTVSTDFVIENTSVTPDTLRRDSTVTNLMVTLEFPEWVTADQIGNEPLVIRPGEVKANNQIIKELAGRTVVIAMFDRAELMENIDQYGPVQLKVYGTLTSGLTYSGDITITITRFAGN